ncbi:MAG TPA: heparinase II/III family protein [Planctomycetota bacterium]|nr:heparinase II/III family protein [Planctomycetota bacterium]
MILESTTVHELAQMLTPHMGLPAWPGLRDAKARAKARQWAKKLGIWQRLGRELDPQKPIPAVKRSEYRDYRRTGSRTVGEAALRGRAQRTEQAALALWLGHPAADLDLLQDLLWAWCETTSWIWPAHERCTIDLGSSHIARLLAEILWMLDGQLEDEVMQRVGAELERRALNALHDWTRPDGWWTVTMNWNHVCNANLLTTALYCIRDVGQLAAFIHPLVQRLDYAIQGFAADGGCLEGPSYWNYGFGHFLDAAVVLHHRTGGKLNLVQGEHIERICRYPLAAHIEGPLRSTFADSSNGYLSAESALQINRFLRIPELYEVAAHTEDGRLAVASWRGLLLYNGERVAGKPDTGDYLLPDLGMVKLRAAGTTLLALAGRNDVPHNHNDIGSFILHKHGACLLTDPGAPRYTAKTFGPKRYEILFCRSRGHSVPRINGKEQPPGAQHHGTLAVEGLNGSGTKCATIDATHAYDEKTLQRLVRRFTLAADGGLELRDDYAFSRTPRSIEEAFITFEPVRIARGGRAAVVGKGRRSLTIASAGAPGRFAAERLVEESKEGREHAVVTRIAFVPARLDRQMTLTFRID